MYNLISACFYVHHFYPISFSFRMLYSRLLIIYFTFPILSLTLALNIHITVMYLTHSEIVASVFLICSDL